MFGNGGGCRLHKVSWLKAINEIILGKCVKFDTLPTNKPVHS